VTGRERLLAACAGAPVDATPVWYMRQAGGRLPTYVRLRERHTVIEIARTPELCAEVTVAAVETLHVDGAVLFADIMLLAEALGVALELTADGPRIDRPVRTMAEVERLRRVDPGTDLGFVLEAIRRVRAALGDRAAVIGLAGGPFTLAAYLLEGAPSRDQVHARAVMHGSPAVWHALLDRIAAATASYVDAQARAGADVIQLFDTWAASLLPAEYASFVAPYARRVLAAAPAPTVHHVARSAALLETFAAGGATVVSIDSRQSLAEGLPTGLPALHRAHRLQERAAGVGFDWPDVAGPIAKVAEELEEVKQQVAADGAVFDTHGVPSGDARHARLEEELGDLLFAVVNLCRKAGTHPALALDRANAKFQRRFEAIEQLAAVRGIDVRTAGLEALDKLWDEVKAGESKA